MAKRKQPNLSISVNAVRWVAISFIFLILFFFAFKAFSSFLKGTNLFVLKNVAVAPELGDISLSGLEQWKGHNIFSIDLLQMERNIISRYPQVGGLKVLRRFPDQVMVTGFRRIPSFLAATHGKMVVVSRDGYLIGSPGEGEKNLAVVKDLKLPATDKGTKVTDEQLSSIFKIIDLVDKQPSLKQLGMKEMHFSDPTRLVVFWGEGPQRFEVYFDGEHMSSQIESFSTIVASAGLDFTEIKYIDMRFGEPVLGKKKGKK